MGKLRLNAMQLAALAVGGATLVAASWFVSFLPIPRVPVVGGGFWAFLWAERLRVLAFVLPGAIGLMLCLWARGRFKQGFRSDLWSEAELARVRSLVGSPMWKWLGLAMTGLALGFLLLHRRGMGGAFVYLLFVPFQTAQELRGVVSPRVVKGSEMADWRNFGPIRSEHWGEPRA